jgi:hypothetical protein
VELRREENKLTIIVRMDCKVAAPLIYDVIYLPIDSNTPLLFTVVLTTPVRASTTKLLSPSVKNRMNGLERQSDVIKLYVRF